MAETADLLVDEYRYLEPDGCATWAEYGDLLRERAGQLAGAAHLYGRMLESADDGHGGAKARLIQHWETYVDAADKTRQVYDELERQGYLRDAPLDADGGWRDVAAGLDG